MKLSHIYGIRRFFRTYLPRNLASLSCFGKGRNCELRQEEHDWFRIDEEYVGCYYCREVRHISLLDDETATALCVLNEAKRGHETVADDIF